MASIRSLLVALLLATLLVTMGTAHGSLGTSEAVRGPSASAPLLSPAGLGIGLDVDSGPGGLTLMLDVGSGKMSVGWGWASLLPT